ncbi:RNA-binding protein 28-like isoform X1 [Ptychodera flava]|uniref:RNA-binding protein 28-like isoform X1 n=2 Tax=Ptychodera flava TaxID=63121 RepID=UPI00396A60C2
MAAPCTTLFVRNLPYSTTNEKLEEVFSDIGPLRRCFVVSKKGSSECRGFGYVTFAMKDDAVKAKTSTVKLEGRKLHLDYANKEFKNRKRKQDAEHEQESPESKKPKPDDNTDEKASYTEMTRTVVLSGLTNDVTKDDLDKLLKRTENVIEVKFPIENENKVTAEIVYTRCKDAKSAIGRLHRKKLKGAVLSADLQSRKRKSFANMKKSRLIVRNLSFKCSEEDLKEVFSEFGQISEVSIPKKSDGKMFGFGFVQFSNVIEATKAVKKVNMKEIKGRPVAVDWAVPKVKYEAAVKQEEENQPKQSQSTESGDSDEDVEQQETMDSEDSDKEDESEGDGSEDGDHSNSDDDDDKSDDEWSDDENSEDESPQKPKEPPPCDISEQKTLFVRNIPFEAEEEDISEKFEEYGKIRYCKLLIDPDTERSRGVAFIKFQKTEDAQKCFEKSEEMDSKTGGISIDGRRLVISMAVSKDDAEKMKKDKKKKKTGKDNRNLHLAREGLIRPGTKAAQSLSESDLSKRSKLVALKKQKLKSLDIFISPTRLSVHNLPKSVTDKQLREIFAKAVKEKGMKITEAKVMRDLSQVNSQNVPKSRGYAFVSFSEHEHALKAVRQVNNNPEIFGPEKRPIVEFSLENKRALESKERRKQKSLLKQQLTQQDKQQVIKSAKKTSKQMVLKTPDSESGQKVKKGLPSHLGPKMRWRNRNKRATAKPPKDKKSRTAVKQNKMKSDQSGTAPAKLMAKAPKVKRQKKKRPASRDDFDKMVQQYQKKKIAKTKAPEKTARKKKSKWFE